MIFVSKEINFNIMNERLEKELNVFWDTELNPNDPANCFEVAKLVSEHFYNLALNDVKEEVQRLYNDPENTGDGLDVGETGAYCGGFSSACEEINLFINKQFTK